VHTQENPILKTEKLTSKQKNKCLMHSITRRKTRPSRKVHGASQKKRPSMTTHLERTKEGLEGKRGSKGVEKGNLPKKKKLAGVTPKRGGNASNKRCDGLNEKNDQTDP